MPSPPLTRREYAYLSVSGRGDYRQISSRLGMEPSEAWSEGDARARGGGKYPCTRWRLDSGLPDTVPVEQHIESLLDRLQTCPDRLRALAPDYQLTLQCVGYYPANGHGVHISQAAVRAAAHLGLDFDLDFYFFKEPE